MPTRTRMCITGLLLPICVRNGLLRPGPCGSLRWEHRVMLRSLTRPRPLLPLLCLCAARRVKKSGKTLTLRQEISGFSVFSCRNVKESAKTLTLRNRRRFLLSAGRVLLFKSFLRRFWAPLIRNAVPQLRVLVLNGSGAAGVVHDGEVGVGLGGGEAHEPPAVVSFHVEAECCREVA